VRVSSARTIDEVGGSSAAPGHVAPGQVAPGEVAPGHASPGEVAPGEVVQVAGADGTPLALHSWSPPEPVASRGLLFYIHGIQSHAGWLFETGPDLARRGVVTAALERRGSGRSGGMRGDLPSARTILDDYRAGLEAVRTSWPALPVTVLGQSFGGSILAALVADGLAADRVVYCAPALGQQRARHSAARLAEVRALTGLEHSPIGLADEDYTDLARYLEFMANDPLMLRQLTARSRATMVELEQSYLGRRAGTSAPVHLARPEQDPIIALDEAEMVLRTLHGSVETATFATRHHYLEFTSTRRDYWDWLADLVLPAERDR
jgi:alpha-beta hydrolase superfamily lysophospholipase